VFKFLKNIRLLPMPTLTGTLNGMAAAKILFSYFCVMAKTNEMLHPGM